MILGDDAVPVQEPVSGSGREEPRIRSDVAYVVPDPVVRYAARAVICDAGQRVLVGEWVWCRRAMRPALRPGRIESGGRTTRHRVNRAN